MSNCALPLRTRSVESSRSSVRGKQSANQGSLKRAGAASLLACVRREVEDWNYDANRGGSVKCTRGSTAPSLNRSAPSILWRPSCEDPLIDRPCGQENSQGRPSLKKHCLQECLLANASITAAGASARNAGDRRYASMTAKGASARSAWGRASAPTSARRARARNAGDRRYASMTASGASARSAWGRASAPTSASSIDARTVAAVPRTDATGAHGGDLGPRPFRQQLYASAFSQLVFRAGIWGFRE